MAITTAVFYAAWVIAVAAVWLLAWRERDRPARWADLNRRLWARWRPAAILAVLFLLASLVRGQLNPIALGVFCMALVGLALAAGIPFQPLPVVEAVRRRRRWLRAVTWMMALGVAANLIAQVAGSAGLAVGALLGEHPATQQLAGSFHVNAWQAFFVLLGGAGVAEEVLFRLVVVTAAWRLTGKAWLAVAVGAVAFAAYHFTPADGFYRTFWQFPIGALASNLLVGMVWGAVYVKRGLETAITGHTLLDWLTFLAFAR